jgi:hypothetical protein
MEVEITTKGVHNCACPSCGKLTRRARHRGRLCPKCWHAELLEPTKELETSK